MSKDKAAGEPKAERAAPDPELAAIRRVQGILNELDPPARHRVMSYLVSRNADLGAVKFLMGEFTAPIRGNGCRPAQPAEVQ